MTALICFQILDCPEKLGGITFEQYALNCQLVAAALFVHCDLCPAWDAAIWRKIQL